jgi:hypothetical protein
LSRRCFRRILFARVAEREGAATPPTIFFTAGRARGRPPPHGSRRAPVSQSSSGTAAWQHFVAAWSRVSWTAVAQSTRGDPRQPQLHLPCARTRLRTTTAAFSVSSRPWSSPCGRSTVPTAPRARRILISACPASMDGHRLTSAKVTRGDPARGFMIPFLGIRFTTPVNLTVNVFHCHE